MTRKIDISHKTVIFIAAFIGILWLLFLILDVILLIFVSIILMSALSPAVAKIEKFKIPRSIAITIVYAVMVSIIVLLLILIITPLVEQTSHLAMTFPTILEKLLPPGVINGGIIQDKIGDFFGNAVNFTIAIFSNLITLVSVAVLSFYLLLDKERFERLLSQLFVNHQDKALGLIMKIENKLGAWLRGQVILSLIIGVLSYILLFALQIPYALPLAILAGLMEVVPVIGPIISAIPAIIVAYTVSPALALFVFIGYIVIQQLENNLVVPQVMKRAVGLNPLVVIIAITVGSRLLGISGALLAVPIVVVVQIIAEELFKMDFELNSDDDLRA